MTLLDRLLKQKFVSFAELTAEDMQEADDLLRKSLVQRVLRQGQWGYERVAPPEAEVNFPETTPYTMSEVLDIAAEFMEKGSLTPYQQARAINTLLFLVDVRQHDAALKADPPSAYELHGQDLVGKPFIVIEDYDGVPVGTSARCMRVTKSGLIMLEGFNTQFPAHFVQREDREEWR